jgi:hypothetical protein
MLYPLNHGDTLNLAPAVRLGAHLIHLPLSVAASTLGAFDLATIAVAAALGSDPADPSAAVACVCPPDAEPAVHHHLLHSRRASRRLVAKGAVGHVENYHESKSLSALTTKVEEGSAARLRIAYLGI